MATAAPARTRRNRAAFKRTALPADLTNEDLFLALACAAQVRAGGDPRQALRWAVAAERVAAATYGPADHRVTNARHLQIDCLQAAAR
ncbi:MAG TPA: hypothetical protein VEK08_15195 [Planctomycetota bacterium]|nr:hypothetical protein [Planctomycetota bacterium]